MKMLFKQKMFSWLDSYDIFSEAGETLYKVKGQLAWGHCLKIYDASGNEIATVKQKIFTWMPKFEMYYGETYVGCISREFTFFKPKYNIECNGWQVEGDWLEWDYSIVNHLGQQVACVSKKIWNCTDTYEIEVLDPRDALCALMLVIAIDAEKCSRDN